MILSAAISLALVHSMQFPIGKGQFTFQARSNLPIDVFTLLPKKPVTRLFVIFHGTLRNAEEYRDHSAALAERFGAAIIAPKFDEARFPSLLYQRGGIMDRDGKLRPKEDWTYSLVRPIVDEARRRLGNPAMPYSLIGHSAGGQFLNRMCAFLQEGAERVVTANPGSLIYPRLTWDFAYGFGNLPAELRSEEALQRYLAQPMTIYSGSADNWTDEYFDDSVDAMRQGAGRYQRGANAFESGRRLAAHRGWKFGWKRVVAEGVEHDHEKMFNHPAMAEALGISDESTRN